MMRDRRGAHNGMTTLHHAIGSMFLHRSGHIISIVYSIVQYYSFSFYNGPAEINMAV
jgi:hypothetical protein